MKTPQTLTKMETALFESFEERLSRLESSQSEFITSSAADSDLASRVLPGLERGMTSLEGKLSPLRESLSKLMLSLDAAQKRNESTAKDVTELRKDYNRLSSQIATLIEVLDA
jgi:chromosome segregation ATPase